ncbi:MAG: hypothetical protein NWS51_00660 [Flavobacteriales bacterium]|nr:hypothetical protein [Flavobacteriales bacterium]
MTTLFNYTPRSEKIILACHIAGVYDVNRSTTLEHDHYALAQAWAESIQLLNLHGVIFHNSFSEETCQKFSNENITFIEVEYNPAFNPNVFRYFVYRDFLLNLSSTIKSIFVTDVSDVVVVQNPFETFLFQENRDTLFCGDEPKTLDNEWMNDHSAHLRNQITGFAEYEQTFAQATLLNCGIIGGSTTVMLHFLESLCSVHEQFNQANKTAFTGDMGAFNFIARTQFNDRLIHGAPVNSIFKGYEGTRMDCWFRHK